VPFDLLDALDELERRRAILRFRSIPFEGLYLRSNPETSPSDLSVSRSIFLASFRAFGGLLHQGRIIGHI
jgi:hypothetical protein